MEFIELLIRKFSSSRAFYGLFIANFLLAIHLFLVVYINSSFLTTFVDEKYVGLIFIVGSLFGLFTLTFATQIFQRFGNSKTLLTLTLLEFLLFIGLAFPGNAYIALLLFIIHFGLFPLMLLSLDILLEKQTKKEANTGNVRGAFITTTNLALVIAPFIAGLILTNGDYYKVFLFSAIFLIPFAIIIAIRFRSFKDPDYHKFSVRALLCIKGNKNIKNIFMAHFIMRLFFAWMVIYTPIYLHEHIGFDWSTIGIMFTVMLLPYLVIEWPAGKIADKILGERELLAVGFVLTAIFVAPMSFITEPSVMWWTALLFMSRTGAALLEIMTETYFFKHVDEDDPNTITGFRMLRPLAYIMGPILATISLFFVDIQYLFLIFSVVILFGLRYTLVLKDTK
jgi:MFS family permease